ncbi:MGMT family protein [Isoptericola sp. b441]|uniref:MGMT family protein n=1 Tax=Actinotalea lenta TaxID=3064654 RepID=A0ABT9D8N0_9CELL|nr:MGMT family protein [Isoptericola sp. b441]MDO8107254.1 MGMT family protein [Isoptericola sp. b441]
MASSWSSAPEVTPEDYLEAVLDLVARVPPGRAVTYGSVAEVLRDRLGVGGPRQVGSVLARAGAGVPWWRVVNAAGCPPRAWRREALEGLRREGCPLTAPPDPDDARVVLGRALWWPDD